MDAPVRGLRSVRHGRSRVPAAELDEHAFERAADPELPSQRLAQPGLRWWVWLGLGSAGATLLVSVATFFLVRPSPEALASPDESPAAHDPPRASAPPIYIESPLPRREPDWGEPDLRCRRARIERENRRVLRRAGVHHIRAVAIPEECAPERPLRSIPFSAG